MALQPVLRASAWLVLAASQLYLLYRLDQASSAAPVDERAVTVTSALSHSPASHDDTVLVLRRIEKRLGQLEQSIAKRNVASVSAIPAGDNSMREPTARERADADQRLLSMLPSGPLSQHDVARFHADIQALPEEERFAMATALARAINEGRVQPGPGGL